LEGMAIRQVKLQNIIQTKKALYEQIKGNIPKKGSKKEKGKKEEGEGKKKNGKKRPGEKKQPG
jgi:hypothetical protein